jgi:soluble lytic murein transglycosylase
VKFLFTLLIGIFLFPLAWATRLSAASLQKLPPALVRLSAKGDSPTTWPGLRRYADSLRNTKDRALAYFVLGYQEYDAGHYDVAAEDLAKASAAGSPLSDFADYYRASAVSKDGHPEEVPAILNSFNKRYPSSTLHYDAIELQAWAYLQTSEPQKALRVLQSEPQVRERPALALVLARAYTNGGQPIQAAETFQDIYYAFPTTPQAGAAGDALKKLKSQLGVRYPQVSDEIATARAERLYSTAHYSEALKGYEQLLKDRQKSTWAWRWNLGRARCLVRLGRGTEAAETLVNSVAPTPQLDAERLATLVDAYAKIEDDTGVAKYLNDLRAQHFKSHWHAVALLRAANYFMYRGEWDIASSFYRTLREAFSQTPQAVEASWRFAWITYLAGTPVDARKALLGHIRNYPNSRHVPSALYFLGRLEENRNPVQARALYEFLTRRYRHSYYALEASNRISVLKKRPIKKSRSSSGPAFSIQELTSRIPGVDPPGLGACLPSARAQDLETFNILDALHLDDLARQDIQVRLVHHPKSPALVLALSRFEAQQGRTDQALHIAKRIIPDYYSQQFSDLPRQVWQLLFPRAHVSVIRRYASINHLDPYLVMGLIRQESGFNPRATSSSNARGLMQVLATTVTHSRRYLNSVRNRLYEPAYNVRYGCAYLRALLKRYNGNVAEALAAYNAGPTNVDRWLSQRTFRNQQEFVESVPFPETRVYLKAVFADSGVYRRLLRGSVHFAECTGRSAKTLESSRAGFRENLHLHSRPSHSNAAASAMP